VQVLLTRSAPTRPHQTGCCHCLLLLLALALHLLLLLLLLVVVVRQDCPPYLNLLCLLHRLLHHQHHHEHQQQLQLGMAQPSCQNPCRPASASAPPLLLLRRPPLPAPPSAVTGRPGDQTALAATLPRVSAAAAAA
jgi:hypothetical protein